MRAVIILLVVCAAVTAAPQQNIVGGWETSIDVYPEIASLLYSYTGTAYRQACGGTILNTRSVLTAAHCVYNENPSRWRIRVGSSRANSGGTVYNVGAIIVHERYNKSNHDNDVAILRTTTNIVYSTLVRQGSLAGSNYNLGDNQTVWATGWGATSQGGWTSETLRHVLVKTVNQTVCKQRYAEIRKRLTDNMLCSGLLDQGGRDQCQGDSGSPLFHNKVVVGVCSWGAGCAQARYPGVNARVTRFTTWIQANA